MSSTDNCGFKLSGNKRQELPREASRAGECDITVSESEECIWHRPADSKTADEVQDALQSLQQDQINGAKLSGLDFDKDANFFGKKLPFAEFNEADCREINFDGAILYGSEFKKANLEDAKFRKGANLEETDFREANCTGAKFHESDLSQAEFRGAELTSAEFNNCNADRMSIQKTSAEDADFSTDESKTDEDTESVLTNLQATEANLVRAEFSGSNLEGSRFKDADIGGTDFSNAMLYDVDFRGVSIDYETVFDEKCTYEVEGELNKAISVYRSVLRAFQENPLNRERMKIQLSLNRVRRRKSKNECDPSWFTQTFLKYLYNYGYSLKYPLLWSSSIIILMSIIYTGLSFSISGQIYRLCLCFDYPETPVAMFHALLLSIQVFLPGTTSVAQLGPIGLGFAALEATTGVFFMSVVVYVLGKKSTL